LSGHEIGALLEFYTLHPSGSAPYLAEYLADPVDGLSCFIAAEAKQQVEDPGGRPIEWTDSDLEGCAAIPPFDVCFEESFRPARLEDHQCPEIYLKQDEHRPQTPTPSKP